MTTLASRLTQNSAVGGLLLRKRVKGGVELAARLLLASVFLYGAIAKAQSYSGVADYMSSYGVPGSLLPVVIATEVLFPIALIIGWQTRIATFLLLGFSVLAAGIFHHNFADPKMILAFFQDLGIVAALLFVLAHGAGRLSLDHLLAGERTESATPMAASTRT